ncbi:MAG: DUF2849 domain-containing protein [Asticcacaulis sp.]|uniref:DUF2849 domain-containing protein n=1 Tax=Asticcacaulis sp. TaxID=1872648 RepID=UPI0039E5A2AB
MKLLTANRLTDGLTIWFGPNGWTEDAAQAARLTDEQGDAALAEWKTRETEVVAPYLIPLSAADAPVQREHVREFVRANGPTIGQTADDIARQHGRGDIFQEY